MPTVNPVSFGNSLFIYILCNREDLKIHLPYYGYALFINDKQGRQERSTRVSKKPILLGGLNRFRSAPKGYCEPERTAYASIVHPLSPMPGTNAPAL